LREELLVDPDKSLENVKYKCKNMVLFVSYNLFFKQRTHYHELFLVYLFREEAVGTILEKSFVPFKKGRKKE